MMIIAKPVKVLERVSKKDPLFGKITVQNYETHVWRIRIRLHNGTYFTSNRKYASEKLARAAADRINNKYERSS